MTGASVIARRSPRGYQGPQPSCPGERRPRVPPVPSVPPRAPGYPTRPGDPHPRAAAGPGPVQPAVSPVRSAAGLSWQRPRCCLRGPLSPPRSPGRGRAARFLSHVSRCGDAAPAHPDCRRLRHGHGGGEAAPGPAWGPPVCRRPPAGSPGPRPSLRPEGPRGKGGGGGGAAPRQPRAHRRPRRPSPWRGWELSPAYFYRPHRGAPRRPRS